MEVNPLAGKPVDPASLVNVPKLHLDLRPNSGAYYSHKQNLSYRIRCQQNIDNQRRE
jgi:hypothetical protein